MQGVRIGTSGWVYKHWAESFYPKDWPKKDEFLFYAQHFPTVEINATFYRLPFENMVKGWRNKAPEGFLFAVKGSRFITHIKRLLEPEAGLKQFFDRIDLLGEKTGPILWQLPPSFHRKLENIERLEIFLKALPKTHKHAVEFRHPSWIVEETLALLKQHNAANVWLSSNRMAMDFTITADFVYLRFHGLEHGAAHDYTEEELSPWAEQLRKAAAGKLPAFVYFNNDLNTRAPLNAKTLMQMVGEPAVHPFVVKFPDEEAPRRRTRTAAFSEPRSKRLHKK